MSRDETSAMTTPEDHLPSSSRALVRLVSTNDAPHIVATPRPALFLAHLIATDQKLAQTRERRRAEPNEVIAAYRETIARIQTLNTKNR